MRILLLGCLVSVAAMAFGCSSSSTGSSSGGPADGGGVDSGGGADGATAPTWTKVYTTIIQPGCTPCHAQFTGLSTGKLDMSSQSNAYNNLVNVAATGASCSGKGTRVVPGNPAQSLLYEKVAQDAPPCGSRMPLGLPALSKDQTDTISAWIAGGAKND